MPTNPKLLAITSASVRVSIGSSVEAIALLKASSGKGFSTVGAAIFELASMIGSASDSKLTSATSWALLPWFSEVALE